MKWSYGITTVPARFNDLLPQTLLSLREAGFTEPRIFIDGAGTLPEYLKQYSITQHVPKLRTAGNWITAAWELYLREPHAERYAVFQDDFVTYTNLREYLERCAYPHHGYLNLYTFPENNKSMRGWYLSNQLGRGAVALVFSNEALRHLLSQPYFVDRPQDPQKGHILIDGGIVETMKKSGWQEYVHNPSLVQHTGKHSSMGSRTHDLADTFLGEGYDAMKLLPKPTTDIQPIAGRHNRVGLVGYHTATGLGELNRQLVAYADIDSWLVRPHPKLGVLDTKPDVDMIICANGNIGKMDSFLNSVDTVLFCEMPFYDELVTTARRLKKRIVCVPMLEWMPAGCKGWPKMCDLFICPTQQAYEDFRYTVPCINFPWPVDTARFKFNPRGWCKRFLFVAGHGGYEGRKGIAVVQEALSLWPDMPLTVISQTETSLLGSNVHTYPPPTHNYELYEHGDVLISPHSVDGLGLEPMEAMACGMPVITTDGAPWNEIPAIGKIKATVTTKRIKRPVNWYLPDARSLVKVCKDIYETSIAEESKKAREWAEERSWEKLAARFKGLLRQETS